MSDASADKTITRSAPPVCLDYAATTPVGRRVASKMIPYLTEIYGNPASRSHAFGWAADEAVLRPDTVLASVMMVNNETGVIQDVAAMGALCRTKKVLFHLQ